MSALDWRSSLTFSDRLSGITRIATAQRTRGPGTDGTDSQILAKALENECYKNASSRQLYDSWIQNHISKVELLPVEGEALREADLNDEVTQLLSGGISIGPYLNAHHHKDGVFSSVFQAKSLKHCPGRDSIWKNGVVALKVTHPSTMIAPHDSKREARMLGAADSKNVIPLFDTFNAKGGDFVLVMPFLPIDLDQLLREGPPPAVRGRSILRDLMQALTHIHSMGMIHRDVKPSNILMKNPNGPAVLADFGIAWWTEDPMSESADNKILDVGTTCYRPPELLFGNQRYNSSLDMWAAGCVAAQVVSLGSRTLFDSGDLGSDLTLVKSIFETLGTPDLDVWPEASNFPDWGKMAFHEYPARPWQDILDGCSKSAVDLVSALVRYESKRRLRASQALDQAYFIS